MKEIAVLKTTVEDVVLENSVLSAAAEKVYIYVKQELGKLVGMRSHFEQVIQAKNRQTGDQRKELNKFKVRIFDGLLKVIPSDMVLC